MNDNLHCVLGKPIYHVRDLEKYVNHLEGKTYTNINMFTIYNGFRFLHGWFHKPNSHGDSYYDWVQGSGRVH